MTSLEETIRHLKEENEQLRELVAVQAKAIQQQYQRTKLKEK